MSAGERLSCEEADRLLDAFAEDALEDADRRAVAEHVAVCTRCAHQVDASRAVGASLASRSGMTPPAAVDVRILAAVEEERRWTRARAQWRRRVAIAAGAGLLGTAAVAAFAVSPVAAWAGNRMLDLMRAASLWLRWSAVPAIEEASGALVGVALVLVAIAATERIASRLRPREA